MRAGKVLAQALRGELHEAAREAGAGSPDSSRKRLLCVTKWRRDSRCSLVQPTPTRRGVLGGSSRCCSRAARTTGRARRRRRNAVPGRPTSRCAVVVSFVQLARPRHHARPDQFQPQRLQQVLLGGGRENPRAHPRVLPRSAALVRAIYQHSFPPGFARRNESALTESVILLHFSLAD